MKEKAIQPSVARDVVLVDHMAGGSAIAARSGGFHAWNSMRRLHGLAPHVQDVRDLIVFAAIGA